MDILEKGSLSYVQAIVLMANYLQKRNKPNAGFLLIGIGFSMAFAVGLHREFGVPRTSPFTMEIRRRTWWTLFIFASGAQLTLGRPAISFVGVNVRLPANLDDDDLAVDMEELPESKPGPTTASCLIAQIKLAKIANAVQVELLTNYRPRYEKAVKLEENIRAWWQGLPPFFDQAVHLEPRLEVPKNILLWRSFHLRVVLNRPFLFEAIATKSRISTSAGQIQSCLVAAEECVSSICGFIESTDNRQRGLAWYATYWLITASFIQATCYSYSPGDPLAASWKSSLQRALRCLESLGPSHDKAFHARNVLRKVFGEYPDSVTLCRRGSFCTEQDLATSPDQSTSVDSTATLPCSPALGAQARGSQNQVIFNPLSVTPDAGFAWYPQGSSNAEFLDAAGGFMFGGFFDGTEDYNTWMPL